MPIIEAAALAAELTSRLDRLALLEEAPLRNVEALVTERAECRDILALLAGVVPAVEDVL